MTDFTASKADYVLETDGGSRGNPGIAGCGAVIRQGISGQVLAQIYKFLGTTTNNVAEYTAVITGLEALYARFPQAVVEVRADSKLVVEQLSGRWKIKDARLRGLAAQVHSLTALHHISYTWVPREENKHADALGNQAMDTRADAEIWDS